ncbi:uncharacterized protein [Littorina saxatilis]|uniref:CCHC-type domain-containing protein n=1 Tax=Littorina saxatilis TaxID=31220 RepID=A0AAN9C1S1_9CAEN
MAAKYPRQCHKCLEFGHMKRDCLNPIKCSRCRKSGHIRSNCPLQDTKSGPGKKVSDRQKRVSSAIKTELVQAFFNGYPGFDEQTWLGPMFWPRSRSQSSISSQGSSGRSSPVLPEEDKDKCSNIRGDESVKRVAEAVFQIKRRTKRPFCILQNKQFQTLQEDVNKGLLCVSKKKADEEELDRGDFDVIILHSVHGYIYIEVKAFGDAQDHLSPEKMSECFLKRLKENAVKRLEKGRKVLECLQIDGQYINIVSTLGLPNITRNYLKHALQKNKTLREDLARCISLGTEGAGQVAVEDLCLCSDDLPPKDGTVDEADVRVRKAIDQWWSNVTRLNTRQKELSPETYRLVLASFCHREEIKNFPEMVQETGRRNQSLRIDEQQSKIIKSGEQYQFITGPPGCGKTVVLAAKSLKLLTASEAVFAIFSHGRLTKQPATEFLIYFMETISGISHQDLDKHFPCFHKKQISDNTNVEDFIENIVEIKNKPKLGKTPQKPKRRAHEEMFDQISGAGDLLKDVFLPSALPGGPTGEEKDNQKTEKGEGINFIIDELTMRTIKGKTTELILAIRKQLPMARVWCAGPFPSHCPQRFNSETLFYSYRCPPKIQRILQALEPFCQYGDASCVHQYVTSSTAVPRSPVTSSCEERYRFPAEGSDPFFMSHAAHRSAEITDCRECANSLVNHLKNTLTVCNCNITEDCGHQLKQSDVLILVTGTAVYRNMFNLLYSVFYQQLTRDTIGYRVNIYRIEDDFDLHRPGVSMMHVRAACGTEKKLVVCVPGRHYQAAPRTYADAVRGTDPPSASPQLGLQGQVLTADTSTQAAGTLNASSESKVNQNQTGSQASISPLGAGMQHLHIDADGETSGAGQGQPRQDMSIAHRAVAAADNSQTRIKETLNKCQHITAAERYKLARLGVLNLHWLWYGASRALSHVVIYHF